MRPLPVLSWQGAAGRTLETWPRPWRSAMISTFSAGSCPPGPGPAQLLWAQPSFTPGQQVSWFPSCPLGAGPPEEQRRPMWPGRVGNQKTHHGLDRQAGLCCVWGVQVSPPLRQQSPSCPQAWGEEPPRGNLSSQPPPVLFQEFPLQEIGKQNE